MNVRDRVRGVLLALAWLVIVVFIALGAAGVVTAMSHLPGTPARQEITWTGDRAAEPALEAATDSLAGLSDEVNLLGEIARDALTQVVAGDLASLTGTIASGTGQLDRIDGQASRLESALAGVPGAGADRELRLSADVVERYDALATTSSLTDDLRAQWAAFTDRALAGASLTSLLARHDEETAAAADQGSAGRYGQALAMLEASDATIAQARELRDRLAQTTDVSTLTAWIDRNAAYDAALRDLYESLRTSKGRVTDAVRRAFAAEQSARRQLPADTRGLVVIMADLARGGLNQAVIAIEEARGALAAALDAQRPATDGSEPQD